MRNSERGRFGQAGIKTGAFTAKTRKIKTKQMRTSHGGDQLFEKIKNKIK